MSPHDKAAISININSSNLVSLWTSKLLGEFPNSAPNYFSSTGLEIAIQTSNLAAVRYFWQLLSATWKIEFLEDSQKVYREAVQDCYHHEYFKDVFYFFFSQMNDRQQLNLLKYDVGKNNSYSRVLVCDCFLYWPYQKYFLQTINQMWNFLPLECFVVMIGNILYIIADREEDYDYHNLILEFWSLSPDNYKSYFRRKSFSFDPFQVLFNIRNFDSSDAAVIICFVENASVEEKEIFRFDIHGRDLCRRLIKELKWKLVELLIRKCISSEEIMTKFKQDIIISIGDGLWFNNFIYQNRLKDLESFINWCLLSGEDDSNNESKVFEEDLHKYRLKGIKKFFHWCILSTDSTSKTTEVSKFKELQTKNKFEIVESLVNWCFTSKQELKKIQRDLINDLKYYLNSEIIKNIPMLKDRVENLPDFIKWCCLSEEEIIQFQKMFDALSKK